MSLNEFHFFNALPSELRVKIWSLALAEPRALHVKCDTGPFQRGVPRKAKSFHAENSLPALLHVCGESRFEALRVYKPHFETEVSPRYTYVAWEQDTIYACGTILPFLGHKDLQCIQRMVLDVKDPAYFGHFSMGILLKMQPNLLELELICHQVTVWRVSHGQRHLKIMKDTFVDTIAEGLHKENEWIRPDIKIIDDYTGELYSFMSRTATLEELEDE
jgi:hypothetical protein